GNIFLEARCFLYSSGIGSPGFHDLRYTGIESVFSPRNFFISAIIVFHISPDRGVRIITHPNGVGKNSL
ncbi:MAG: hypothetical protein LBC20_17125, partial [Planctomycetaceae bacterium]|nr:hypothetical protein [Planctomycetaceae bacterium]